MIEVFVEPINPIDIEIQGELIPVGEYDHFKGEYSVTPKLESQTLKTKNKVMDFDVDVEKIPIDRISNSSGGNTIIIGG